MKIVMTGATSGFGLEAARRLLEAAAERIVVGARRPDDLPEALRHEAVSALPLDLERFASVRAFAEALGDEPIDVLVLNAGIQLTKPERAPNGMEKTFVVNQLSHFLLLDLLRDRLTPNARVVFTGSGTHDPAEKTPVPAPVHADAERLAWPERDDRLPKPAQLKALRAYASSKLANIMTARELARREEGLGVMAFDPGYVPGTALGRDYPWLVQKMMHAILPLVMKKDRASSIPNSGRLLALAMIDPRYDGERGTYWSVRGRHLLPVHPSELAQDDDAARLLWEDCRRLVHVE